MYVVTRRIFHEPALARQVGGHKPMLEQEENVNRLKPVLQLGRGATVTGEERHFALCESASPTQGEIHRVLECDELDEQRRGE
jgi:hypothetical protein